jgi:hypothetical protein
MGKIKMDGNNIFSFDYSKSIPQEDIITIKEDT